MRLDTVKLFIFTINIFLTKFRAVLHKGYTSLSIKTYLQLKNGMSSLSPLKTHLTTCTNYPIGRNALWEGHNILSGVRA